jgi:hypothetical protein
VPSAAFGKWVSYAFVISDGTNAFNAGMQV